MANIILTPLFLGNLRGWEWIIIFLVVLLLFGGRKIPELMRGLGKGVHSFRKGMQEAREEMNRPLDEPDTDTGKDDKKTDSSSKA
ncbi:MAG: twin-arginine translocase TatA/TatE family subunit [Muribaculaceae bacterium]|nr:twin-arginine translocase TatA/TatE family subunit [Muribaculaceae bacterium]